MDRYFRGAEVVTLRSAWEDRDALYVAFKAGDNRANHSHLDLGSFVLDTLGTRWALDLGADNYNLPGYFGNKRWTYYRLRAEGHNTLVIDPGGQPDQNPSANALITAFHTERTNAWAVADLSNAYPSARVVHRGISLRGRTEVLVQDEISSEKPMDVWWFMHTPSEITIQKEGRAAVLRQQGKRLWAQLISPSGAQFLDLPAKPLESSPDPAGQKQNGGIRKLAVHLPGVKSVRLTIQFVPLKEGDAFPTSRVDVLPLSSW